MQIAAQQQCKAVFFFLDFIRLFWDSLAFASPLVSDSAVNWLSWVTCRSRVRTDDLVCRCVRRALPGPNSPQNYPARPASKRARLIHVFVSMQTRPHRPIVPSEVRGRSLRFWRNEAVQRCLCHGAECRAKMDGRAFCSLRGTGCRAGLP